MSVTIVSQEAAQIRAERETPSTSYTNSTGSPVASFTGAPTDQVDATYVLQFSEVGGDHTVRVTSSLSSVPATYSVTESGTDGGAICPGMTVTYAATVNDGDVAVLEVRVSIALVADETGALAASQGYPRSHVYEWSGTTANHSVVDGDAAALVAAWVFLKCTGGGGTVKLENTGDSRVDDTVFTMNNGDVLALPLRVDRVSWTQVTATFTSLLIAAGN